MHFRVLKGYLKENKKYINVSYLMWLSKMFLVISKKDRVMVGAELKGELRSGGGSYFIF